MHTFEDYLCGQNEGKPRIAVPCEFIHGFIRKWGKNDSQYFSRVWRQVFNKEKHNVNDVKYLNVK